MQLLHSKILGTGKPLLILHGLLGMGDNWITLGRDFAGEGFEVHLIDQRNHGKSFHSTEMNYEVMVEDIFSYIKYYQLENVNIIGHSMGGKTAMHFAMTYPKLLNKLVVVDIAPIYYPPHHHFIFETFRQIDLSNYNHRSDITQAIESHVNNKAISNFMAKNLQRDKTGKFYWKANISILEESLEELGESIPAQSIFNNPTLFIKGEKSAYIKTEYQSTIHAHFPNSQIITINHAGHWVHAEQKPAFFKEVLHFLNN